MTVRLLYGNGIGIATGGGADAHNCRKGVQHADKVMDAVMGMRVSPEVEIEGLDAPEMGVHGYPEVQGPSTVVRHLPSPSGAFGQVGTAAMVPERS